MEHFFIHYHCINPIKYESGILLFLVSFFILVYQNELLHLSLECTTGLKMLHNIEEGYKDYEIIHVANHYCGLQKNVLRRNREHLYTKIRYICQWFSDAINKS